MNILLSSIGTGLFTFFLMLFIARNKHTRIILSGAAAIWAGLSVYLFANSILDINSLEFTFANTPLGFTYFTSAALAFTLFINDRFNYPLIHYAALFALLFFSVAATQIIFPTDVYQSLREGISVEILAGGVSTFLIFITIDAFNDQDAEQKHKELLQKIDQLQMQVDALVQASQIQQYQKNNKVDRV